MSFSHSLQMYCNKALPTFKLFIPHTTPSYSASSASFSSMVIPCNLLALQGSDHFNSTSLTSDNFPVIVDSGCTIAASSDLDDFKLLSYTATQNITLRCISADLQVAGIGYINWTFTDQQNKPTTMHLHTIHIPGLAVHLLPPQQIVSAHSAHCKNSFIGSPTRITLIYNNHEILFSYDHHTNLPTWHTIPGAQQFTSFTEQLTLAPPPNSMA